MGFTDPTFATNNVQSLADQPSETASVVKQTFDQASEDIKTFLNTHIDELESTTDGASGIDNVGMTPIDGVMTTPQQSLEYLKHRIDVTQPTLKLYSVLDYGAGNGEALEDTLAFQTIALLIKESGGGVIIVPEVSSGYFINDSIVFYPQMSIVGIGKPVINFVNTLGKQFIRREASASSISYCSIYNVQILGELTSGDCLDVRGMPYFECDNVSIDGFGGTGLRQGISTDGFLKDGNYQKIGLLFISDCGHALSGDEERCGVILDNAANSETFLALRLKGNLKRGVFINNGNNNTFLNPTFESIEGFGVIFGSAADDNTIINPRMESVANGSGYTNPSCFYYETGSARNVVIGGHYTGYSPGLLEYFVTSTDKYENTFIFDMLTRFNKITTDNLIVGNSGRFDIQNEPGNLDEVIFRLKNNDLTLSANQLLGALEFYNSDTTIGGEGSNAQMRCYSDGSSGEQRLEFWTGTSLASISKRFTIKANGQIIPELPTYADNATAIAGGLLTGALYKTATGEVRIVL